MTDVHNAVGSKYYIRNILHCDTFCRRSQSLKKGSIAIRFRFVLFIFGQHKTPQMAAVKQAIGSDSCEMLQDRQMYTVKKNQATDSAAVR